MRVAKRAHENHIEHTRAPRSRRGIVRGGVLRAAAHIVIAREHGKIVREDTHIEELDDIDGGGQMEVRSVYVDFPEEKLKRELSADAIIRAREFWQYENGGGQVRS